MRSLARWCVTHRLAVIGAWVVVTSAVVQSDIETMLARVQAGRFLPPGEAAHRSSALCASQLLSPLTSPQPSGRFPEFE